VLRIVFCAALILPLGGGSCDEVARNHPISLEEETFKFHQALKNKNFAAASGYMKEELREGFLEQWRRAESMLEVQEVEVTRVEKAADMEYAQVDAKLTYIVAGSLTVKQHRIFELWKGEGKTWLIDQPVRAPPEIAPADLPPADAVNPPTRESSFGGSR